MTMIPTSAGPMTPAGIVDHLTYCSYRANRGYGMSAADLKTFWPQSGDAMEARYQAEITIEKARTA